MVSLNKDYVRASQKREKGEAMDRGGGERQENITCQGESEEEEKKEG